MDLHSDWISAGWEAIEASPFFSVNGPVLRRREDGAWRYALPTRPGHANVGNRVHGGMIMAFADYVLGMAAYERLGDAPSVTVQLNVSLVSAARLGSLMESEAELVRHAGELAFMRGRLFVADRTIATADGIWKVVGKG